MTRASGALGAAVCVAATLALTACIAPAAEPPEQGCVPARMVIEPNVTASGQTVAVSAPAVECALDLPDRTVFQLRLQSEEDRSLSIDFEAELAADGAFATKVTVPEGFPDGIATIFLVNYEIVDWCPGYSMPQARAAGAPAASCAGYDGNLTIGG